MEGILTQRRIHISNFAFKGNLKHIQHDIHSDVDPLLSGYPNWPSNGVWMVLSLEHQASLLTPASHSGTLSEPLNKE